MQVRFEVTPDENANLWYPCDNCFVLRNLVDGVQAMFDPKVAALGSGYPVLFLLLLFLLLVLVPHL